MSLFEEFRLADETLVLQEIDRSLGPAMIVGLVRMGVNFGAETGGELRPLE